MATEKILSAAITTANLGSLSRNTSGQGGLFMPRQGFGFCAVTSGVTAAGASFYRLVRVPRNVMMKRTWLWLDATSTTITGDLGIYYSNSNFDGTTPTNVAAADTPINADHFASAVALAAIVTPTDYTSEAGTYLGADRLLPLWSTASSGLTVDPGGMFDIVFTLTSTAGAAAVVNCLVEFALPGT